MDHATYIVFLFALGACIGSFLNVVVWRLPRGESLSTPPSHCPKCNQRLKWYDNIPIFGWIKLAGKCRFCREPISMRYPIVEAITALLFVFYYVMYYIVGIGPCSPVPHLLFADAEAAQAYMPPNAPIFLLHLFLVSALLAASLIDAELFLIPGSITWVTAAVGIVAHAVFDDPRTGGSLNLVQRDGSPSYATAIAAGAAIGLAISLLLAWKKILPQSFPTGEPLLDVEREAADAEAEAFRKKGESPPPLPPPYSRQEIRREMRKEMAFLLPPMLLGLIAWILVTRVPSLGSTWESITRPHWVSGLLGSLLGALVGGFVVWLTRILGTLGFGRVAMGLGDVDLMFAVGAVLGAGSATVAFFIAPFFGLILAVYMIVAGSRRELPYGPYLSLASATVMLCYCPIAAWLEPGMSGIGLFLRDLIQR